ncbi:hypothetical protein R1flu_005070 [Riccia fluitans]|uniref:Uncharacterized protein n=1 Tax=Riccia fluitans TaxID=41844 RepID=A0ABD1YSM8_9MARC
MSSWCIDSERGKVSFSKCEMLPDNTQASPDNILGYQRVPAWKSGEDQESLHRRPAPEVTPVGSPLKLIFYEELDHVCPLDRLPSRSLAIFSACEIILNL